MQSPCSLTRGTFTEERVSRGNINTANARHYQAMLQYNTVAPAYGLTNWMVSCISKAQLSHYAHCCFKASTFTDRGERVCTKAFRVEVH